MRTGRLPHLVNVARLALGVVGLLCHVGVVRADEKTAQYDLFEKSIRPVLVKHCYECHSAEAAKRGKLQAGLLLDTRQGLLTGGESGAAIVPGNSKKSLLIAALKYESYEMPPSGRLPIDVIDKFTKWVDAGAHDPRGAATAPAPRRAAFQITAEDRSHWSFQPVRAPALPKIQQEKWIRRDLDRFILARLEGQKISPSPRADKVALLRRATFALTGLPPTPAEIRSFLADDHPDAFEKVVDRLLASPEFGIQWGQRWLDGVRYSDSVDKSGAYRRWVIRSFNEDRPYDQFVKLQVAGDLIPAGTSDPRRVHASGASLDGITATGMMSLAVWEIVGRDLAVAEIVDSQIDVVGRQLLGLTLSCARCHDHKFDPISIRDYYAMAGVFFSSHIVTGKLVADGRLGNELIEVPLLNVEQTAINRRLDDQVSKLESRIKDLSRKFPQAARLQVLSRQIKKLDEEISRTKEAAAKKKHAARLAPLKSEEKKLLADQKAKGWDKNPAGLSEIAELQRQIEGLKGQKVTAPTVTAIAEGGVPGSNREKIGDAPVYLRGDFQREGAIVPRNIPAILTSDKSVSFGQHSRQSGRRELAEWIASPGNPLTPRVMVNRVWQQLFGQGIVRTPDNFGRLGDAPTHPELLDHLSHQFVTSGWSVKKLVREIMLSATYQQSSLVTSDQFRIDLENRLVGRMNRRRLTYEELRDSLLFVGGKLELEERIPSPDRGAPSTAETTTSATTNSATKQQKSAKQKTKLSSATQPKSTKKKNGKPKSDKAIPEKPTAKPSSVTEKRARRTIYESLSRQKVNVTSAIFDGPDGKTMLPTRAETTTAPQALYLLNNPLVSSIARQIVAQLQQNPELKTDDQRLEHLWLTVLGRRPDKQELLLARPFVAQQSWERFVHALLASNEFVYVD